MSCHGHKALDETAKILYNCYSYNVALCRLLYQKGKVFMELSSDLSPISVLDKFSAFFPKSFQEFNDQAANILAEIAPALNLTKVVYNIHCPKVPQFFETAPKNVVLYSGEDDEALDYKNDMYEYYLPPKASIEFRVRVKSVVSEDVIKLQQLVFKQLYHGLASVCQDDLLKQLSLLDLSTGIANHEAFLMFADNITASGHAKAYTALYFNIHNFKSVHKALTYTEANQVMIKYCKIIANAVSRHEIIARLGGDNFVALILQKNCDYFMDLIQHMVVKFEKDGQTYSFLFGATVGAAHLTDEKDGGEVMLHISLAYQSARESRTLLKYYDENTNLEIIEHKIILSRFTRAINEHEFFAVYQPKVDAKTHRLIGAEALVRWRHDGGLIMPGSFIPVFEKDGCVTALDFYVLEEVCRFLRKLDETGMGMVKMSVNFSKRHLANNRLVEEIVDVIDKYDVPHEFIEIELTEGEDYQNHAKMRNIVDELKLLGIKTSLDDFGTGYSSLSMLKTLQIDELKIDRSFIPQSQSQSADRSMRMLRGIITLAKSLGCTIVAEGVETTEQLKLIQDMNCDTVQGYLFDKPLPESDFIERVNRSIYNLE